MGRPQPGVAPAKGCPYAMLLGMAKNDRDDNSPDDTDKLLRHLPKILRDALNDLEKKDPDSFYELDFSTPGVCQLHLYFTLKKKLTPKEMKDAIRISESKMGMARKT